MLSSAPEVVDSDEDELVDADVDVVDSAAECSCPVDELSWGSSDGGELQAPNNKGRAMAPRQPRSMIRVQDLRIASSMAIREA
ncbi:MAG: hypothetical protein AAF799_05745 [Myxococcota bacterium]